jgi:RNA ligase
MFSRLIVSILFGQCRFMLSESARAQSERPQALSPPTIVSEGAFYREVMQRDGSRCVICGSIPEGVIHLMDLRLWDGDGEYVDNGVTLCAQHHLAAIITDIPLDDLRRAANIAELWLPPHLYASTEYDRWGNPLMPDGSRARGELFQEPDVQAHLKRGGRLESFVHWVKYPRTHVVPWSPSKGDGDRWMTDVANFEGQRVIVTEKMDGENVSLYRDHRHTRSLMRIEHPSRDWLDSQWEKVRDSIPYGWRICGEYLFVTHSIVYDNLCSYLHAFSVWDDDNWCLAWDETKAFLGEREIEIAPVVYDGIFDQNAIHEAWIASPHPQSEGYVIRLASSFHYAGFRRCVGKYIRSGYQQSEPLQSKAWRQQVLGKRA